jgi:hypothetical protein
MDGMSNLNLTTTNGSDAQASGSPIPDVVAAVLVAVVVLMAIVRSVVFPQLSVPVR